MLTQAHYTSDTSMDTNLYGQLVLQALKRGHMCKRMGQAVLLIPSYSPFTPSVRRLALPQTSDYYSSFMVENFTDSCMDSGTAFLQN